MKHNKKELMHVKVRKKQKEITQINILFSYYFQMNDFA